NHSPDPVRSWTKEMDEEKGMDSDPTAAHQANFYEAIRANNPKLLRGEIEEIFESCALCLLANISYRVGRKLEFDPAAEKFKGADAADANALLSRAYRKPYTIEKI